MVACPVLTGLDQVEGLLGSLEAAGEDVSLTAVYLAAVCPPEQSAQLLSAVEDPIQKARLSNDITRLHTRRSRHASSTQQSALPCTTGSAHDLHLHDDMNEDDSGRASLNGYLQQDLAHMNQASHVHQSIQKVEAWNTTQQDICLQPTRSTAEQQQQQRLADLATLQTRMQALACIGKLDAATLSQVQQQLCQLKAQLSPAPGSPAAPPIRSKSDVYAQCLVDQMEAVRSSLQPSASLPATQQSTSTSQALKLAMQQVADLQHRAEVRRSSRPASPARPPAPAASPMAASSPSGSVNHTARAEHLKQLQTQLAQLMARQQQPPASPTRHQPNTISTPSSPATSMNLSPSSQQVSSRATGAPGSGPGAPTDKAVQNLKMQAINMFAAKAGGSVLQTGAAAPAVALMSRNGTDVEQLRREAAALLSRNNSLGSPPRLWTGKDI